MDTLDKDKNGKISHEEFSEWFINNPASEVIKNAIKSTLDRKIEEPVEAP